MEVGRALSSAGRGRSVITFDPEEDTTCDAPYEDSYGGGGRGGRGGRGGGRGRGSGFRGRGGGGGGRTFNRDDDSNFSERNNDGRQNKDGEPSDKPRELYIPPEPTNNEDEMFGAGITSGINFDKYYNVKVQVSGENPPPAIESFEKSGLRPLVLDNVRKSNYAKPTPIQKRAIPIIMAGRDLMGCAQTGSGKTAAFMLPIINLLLEDKPDRIVSGGLTQPQVIILSPTRELAIQIFSEARKFAHGSAITCCIAYGGTGVYHQSSKIREGCHILVATAGRLLDFVDRNYLSFESVKYFVLDEADRMLDMGFMGSIEKIISHPTMPPIAERQTVMFSATFPEAIQRLASKFLNNYIFVTVGILGGACADVEQVFYNVDKYQKKAKLKELLQDEGSEHTMIFVETKRSADFIAAYISEGLHHKATSIHGDRQQREREMALSQFKSHQCNILVATGVAARGLDIKDVKHVINFDLPKSIDEYVHRIGRTGRVGNRGRATSFFDSDVDTSLAPDLVKILEQAEQNIPDFLSNSGSGKGYYSQGEFGGEDVRNNAVVDFNNEETW